MASPNNGMPALPPPRSPLWLVGTDRSYQTDIIVASVITVVISSFFLSLRIYTRKFLLRLAGWEDWLLVLAQAFAICSSILFIYAATMGMGTHMWQIPPQNYTELGKNNWIGQLSYSLCIFVAQVSVALLYIRVWATERIRVIAQLLLGLIIIDGLYALAATLTACVPLKAYWELELQATSYCQPQAVWWAALYTHVVIDFIMFCLPMPIIWKLSFPLRQKMVLFFIFALGFFTCILTVIRLVGVKLIIVSSDPFYDQASLAIWTVIELNTNIIIASAMTLKPLLSKFYPGLFEPSHSESSDHHLPTIGSTPVRGADQAHKNPWQQWMHGGRHGDVEAVAEEIDLKGSEGGFSSHPSSPSSNRHKDSDACSAPSSGPTLHNTSFNDDRD